LRRAQHAILRKPSGFPHPQSRRVASTHSLRSLAIFPHYSDRQKRPPKQVSVPVLEGLQPPIIVSHPICYRRNVAIRMDQGTLVASSVPICSRGGSRRLCGASHRSSFFTREVAASGDFSERKPSGFPKIFFFHRP